MRKFAAHYLLTDRGLLLKNGLAVADSNGSLSFIDTKGELAEVEQMIFLSGLLIAAFEFTRREQATYTPRAKEEPPLLLDAVLQKDHLTLKEVIDLAKQLQEHFPKKNVPQLLHKIEQVFLCGGFSKNTVSELYFLSGLDLGTLRFTPATRLKKMI